MHDFIRPPPGAPARARRRRCRPDRRELGAAQGRTDGTAARLRRNRHRRRRGGDYPVADGGGLWQTGCRLVDVNRPMANERLKDYISFVNISSSWELTMAKENLSRQFRTRPRMLAAWFRATLRAS